jgi:adenylylsulfate kinase
MSIYHEIHLWNRRNCPNYFEVWVEVDLDALQSRDARGLYSRANNGETSNVPGLDLDYERPLHPDLILTNNPPFREPAELSNQILRSIERGLPKAMAKEIINQTQASEYYYEN